jgi:hypothetical protein
MRNHDQIGWRKSGKVALAPGIDMNDLAAEFKHDAAVIHRHDPKLPAQCLDRIGLTVRRIAAGNRRQSE